MLSLTHSPSLAWSLLSSSFFLCLCLCLSCYVKSQTSLKLLCCGEAKAQVKTNGHINCLRNTQTIPAYPRPQHIISQAPDMQTKHPWVGLFSNESSHFQAFRSPGWGPRQPSTETNQTLFALCMFLLKVENTIYFMSKSWVIYCIAMLRQTRRCLNNKKMDNYEFDFKAHTYTWNQPSKYFFQDFLYSGHYLLESAFSTNASTQHQKFQNSRGLSQWVIMTQSEYN